MQKTNRPKTFTYKLAKFHEPANKTLQQMLLEALVSRPENGMRREPCGSANQAPSTRLISEFRADGDFLTGVVVHFEHDSAPPLLVNDIHALTLPITQFKPPNTDDGKRQDFVAGFVYFGVVEDHLVLMQSQALRSSHLEAHLNWLLTHAGAMSELNRVTLADRIPPATREAVDRHHVREVRIGGELIAPALPSGQASHDETVEARSFGHGAGRAWSAIKQLMDPADIAKLNLDDLDNSNLEYTLKVRFRHSTTEKGQRLLDNIAVAFRNVEEGDASIQLAGGAGVIKGEQLKLSGTVSIETYNGVPVFDHVSQEMRQWLLAKL